MYIPGFLSIGEVCFRNRKNHHVSTWTLEFLIIHEGYLIHMIRICNALIQWKYDHQEHILVLDSVIPHSLVSASCKSGFWPPLVELFFPMALYPQGCNRNLSSPASARIHTSRSQSTHVHISRVSANILYSVILMSVSSIFSFRSMAPMSLRSVLDFPPW